MTAFTKALKKVLASEGGYVNDPDDPGGETYKGISRRYWPKWGGWKYIDKKHWNIANSYVANFYYHKFWHPLKCNYLQEELATFLFDSGVNLGKKPAIKLLQETYNVYRESGQPGLLKVDGIIGPLTIKALNSMKVQKFVNQCIEARIVLYFMKCEKLRVKYKYLRGWVIRTLKYLVK